MIGTFKDLLFDQFGGGGGGSGAMTQISQTVLGASQANITFSSIPSTYTDLVLTFQGRSDNASLTTNLVMQFNADTAANYDYVLTLNNNGTVTGNTGTATANPLIGTISAATNSANFAGICQVLIPNYMRTTFQKSAYANSGVRNATTPTVFATTGFMEWNSTVAITQVLIQPAAGNFITGSIATLWGIK